MTGQTDILEYAEQRGFGDIHIKLDTETGLRAIIAIHNTQLGPALGGCRCLAYPSFDAALYDALRLARAMSYKAALANLPLGGGKAVLLKPPHIRNRTAYFQKFGQFINTLNGNYITAEDSGTNVADMQIIASHTDYVTGHKPAHDPSPFTARGVKRGIEAAVAFKLQRDSLRDVHVAIQGVGNVGHYLAKELHAAGAKLTIADINPMAVERCVTEFGANTVPTNSIHQVACDVFSPCALGAVLNEQTIPQIKASIVAGSANNQLDHTHHSQLLNDHNILYAPDYVINSGGLIYVARQYFGESRQLAEQQIDCLYQTLYTIFERAQHEQQLTDQIAYELAKEKLNG